MDPANHKNSENQGFTFQKLFNPLSVKNWDDASQRENYSTLSYSIGLATVGIFHAMYFATCGAITLAEYMKTHFNNDSKVSVVDAKKGDFTITFKGDNATIKKPSFIESNKQSEKLLQEDIHKIEENSTFKQTTIQKLEQRGTLEEKNQSLLEKLELEIDTENFKKKSTQLSDCIHKEKISIDENDIINDFYLIIQNIDFNNLDELQKLKNKEPLINYLTLLRINIILNQNNKTGNIEDLQKIENTIQKIDDILNSIVNYDLQSKIVNYDLQSKIDIIIQSKILSKLINYLQVEWLGGTKIEGQTLYIENVIKIREQEKGKTSYSDRSSFTSVINSYVELRNYTHKKNKDSYELCAPLKNLGEKEKAELTMFLKAFKNVFILFQDDKTAVRDFESRRITEEEINLMLESLS